jgi:hypothetical protein
MSTSCNLKLTNCRKLHVKFSTKIFHLYHFFSIKLFYNVKLLQNIAECDIFMLWISDVEFKQFIMFCMAFSVCISLSPWWPLFKLYQLFWPKLAFCLYLFLLCAVHNLDIDSTYFKHTLSCFWTVWFCSQNHENECLSFKVMSFSIFLTTLWVSVTLFGKCTIEENGPRNCLQNLQF